MFLFISFDLLAFRSHSFLVLLGRELLLLVQKIMSAFPAITSSREENDVELDGGIFPTAVSLMAQVDPSPAQVDQHLPTVMQQRMITY